MKIIGLFTGHLRLKATAVSVSPPKMSEGFGHLST
jgi:hypothetical protein